MGDVRGSASETREAIAAAATRLFSERGLAAVTVRDIAAEAGVNHALVHRYFGTKDAIVREVIEREIAAVAAIMAEAQSSEDSAAAKIRMIVRYLLGNGAGLTRLIVEARLAGLDPASIAVPVRPIRLLADRIALDQAAAPERFDVKRPDPNLIAVVLGSSLFSLDAMGPWLMNALGLGADQYAARLEEIVEIVVFMIALASGLEYTRA